VPDALCGVNVELAFRPESLYSVTILASRGKSNYHRSSMVRGATTPDATAARIPVAAARPIPFAASKRR